MPLRQVCLQRLARIGRHLGRKRADLFCLRRQQAELFAPESRLQLYHVSEVLCARQGLGQVKGRIDIPAGDVDELAVERGSTLTGSDTVLME